VFHGWADPPPPLQVRPAGEVTHERMRLRAFDFESEEHVELRLWLLKAAKVERPSLIVLTSVDEAGWREWAGSLGPAFQKLLLENRPPPLDAAKFDQNRRACEFYKWGYAVIAPRGIGPTRWAESETIEGQAVRKHVQRRFALIGQTLDGQRVWDVRRAVQVLRGLEDFKSVPVWLQGKEDMAGIVLYAALFEPDVAQLDLYDLPSSHRQGPTLLNVCRVFDLPQAVALALPREVRLHVKDAQQAQTWGWPLQLQKALGQEALRMQITGE
jgi:hypothetical protein